MCSESCLIQITNIAPSVTTEQMSTLFGFIGQIKEIQIYPKNDLSSNQGSKVCFLKYAEPWCTGVAQHLTNTVFIDRALVVLPFGDDKIPDETTALSLTSNAGLGGSNSGIVNQVVLGVKGEQIITTIDPRLTALGLPQYPPLPANMDPSKIEEIRRTVYVGNLDSCITAEQLLTFFNRLGEVKYVRMAGDEAQPTRFAFVEFTEQSSVANALQYNGVILGGRALKINHSNNAIVKPQAKSNEAAQKEIEEAMKRVREAQSLISAAIEPTNNVKVEKMENESKEKSRSRSGSKSKSKDRSSSRSRHRRSHSRTRRSRERSRSRIRRSRERSRSRIRRSRERSRRSWRSRSSSSDRRHRRRGSERSDRKSKDRDLNYSRDRDRERDRDRKRFRDRDRLEKRDGDKDRGRDRERERDRDRDRNRDRDREKNKDRQKDKEKSRRRSSSRSNKKMVDDLCKEKRKERLLKDERRVTPKKTVKPKQERPPENDHSENSRSSFDKEQCPSQAGSETSCQNCGSSASEEQAMEGPALPPEYTGAQ